MSRWMLHCKSWLAEYSRGWGRALSPKVHDLVLWMVNRLRSEELGFLDRMWGGGLLDMCCGARPWGLFKYNVKYLFLCLVFLRICDRYYSDCCPVLFRIYFTTSCSSSLKSKLVPGSVFSFLNGCVCTCMFSVVKAERLTWGWQI